MKDILNVVIISSLILLFISSSGCISAFDAATMMHTPIGTSVNCDNYGMFVEKHVVYDNGKYKTVATTSGGDWFYVGTDYNHTPLNRQFRTDDSIMLRSLDVNSIHMYTLENITRADDGVQNHCVVIP